MFTVLFTIAKVAKVWKQPSAQEQMGRERNLENSATVKDDIGRWGYVDGTGGGAWRTEWVKGRGQIQNDSSHTWRLEKHSKGINSDGCQVGLWGKA